MIRRVRGKIGATRTDGLGVVLQPFDDIVAVNYSKFVDPIRAVQINS